MFHMVKTGDVMLRIELEDGQDVALLEELANELRAELLEEEIAEDISSPSGTAPDGAKSAEWLEIGALSLQVFVYSIKTIEVLVKALKARGLKGSLEAPTGARLNLSVDDIAERENFLKAAS